MDAVQHFNSSQSTYADIKLGASGIEDYMGQLSLHKTAYVPLDNISEEYQDLVDTTVIERDLLTLQDLGEPEANMDFIEHRSTTYTVTKDDKQGLPYYYFIRISPRELDPRDIVVTYETTDNFQIHTWILAEGDMGTSVTSNRNIEYLPLGRDNVRLIEKLLDDYLDDFLDHDAGDRLWLYVVLPDYKYFKMSKVMYRQIDQVTECLQQVANEVGVTVHVVNDTEAENLA